MAVNEKLNLTMLCDFYELTMGNGYFANGYKDRICYFDVFFRQCPDKGGFAIAAGLEQIVHYIQDLHLTLRILRICVSATSFLRSFLRILRTSAFPVISGQFRREHRFSPENPLWWFVPRQLKRS